MCLIACHPILAYIYSICYDGDDVVWGEMTPSLYMDVLDSSTSDGGAVANKGNLLAAERHGGGEESIRQLQRW